MRLKVEQELQDAELALDVVIDFKPGDPPVFELENFEVKALSCSLRDVGWSMQLPAVTTYGSDITISLDNDSN